MAVTVAIAGLNATPHRAVAHLPTVWCGERLAGVYTAISPEMRVDYSAVRHGDVVEIHAALHGTFGCACSRCATPVEVALATEFAQHFVGPGHLDAGGDPEIGGFDGDPDVSEHDGVVADLTELCIEYAILALPDVPLCREDCRGLCPSCGTNRNEEVCGCAAQPTRASPWAKLAELRVPKS